VQDHLPIGALLIIDVHRFGCRLIIVALRVVVEAA